MLKGNTMHNELTTPSSNHTTKLENRLHTLQVKANELQDIIKEVSEDLKHSYVLDILIANDIGYNTIPSDNWYGYSHDFWYKGYRFRFTSDMITGDDWNWSCTDKYGSKYSSCYSDTDYKGNTRYIGDLISNFIQAVDLFEALTTVFPGTQDFWQLQHDSLVFKLVPEYSNWNIDITLAGRYIGCIAKKLYTDGQFVFEGENNKLAYYEAGELKILAQSEIAKPLPIYLSDPDVSIGVIIANYTDSEIIIIHNGTLHCYSKTSDGNHQFHTTYKYPEFTNKLELIGVNCDWVEKCITDVLTKLTAGNTKK